MKQKIFETKIYALPSCSERPKEWNIEDNPSGSTDEAVIKVTEIFDGNHL